MRKVKKYDGEAPEMYAVIAPLIMSDTVAKYFNRLPVTTSQDHKWYALLDNNIVCAFVAVIHSSTTFTIRFLYLNEDCAKVQSFEELIKVVMDDFRDSEYETAKAVARAEDVKYWKRFGFEVTDDGKNWCDMQKTK